MELQFLCIRGRPNFFSKGPASKYFSLCRTHMVSVTWSFFFFFFFLETFENGKPGYTKQTWLQFSDPALGQRQSTITVDLDLAERAGVAEATELILTKLYKEC